MIKVRTVDGVVIITLSNGPTNSITLDGLRQIDSIVREVNEDDSIKGLILTGDGKFFSSGFHLPDFIGFKSHEDAIKWFEEEEDYLINFFTCRKPVVSAINGHCAAAGLIWSFAADYRIAANNPKIRLGMSEIKIGLALSIAQSKVVRFGLDSDRTFRNVMCFADMMNVNKALEIGMIDEICENDQLIERARLIINAWIDTPGRPFMTIKRLMRKETADGIRQFLDNEPWREELDCFMDPGVKGTLEFVQAVLEQRA